MNDIAAELAKLHELTGAEYSRQVERIARMGEFHPLQDETNIYTVGGESSGDYKNLLNAARKAVAHGYRVYILPNPKGFRSPDFILEQKGNYKVYDIKTIHGNASVGSRLKESVGQTGRVLLNMRCKYDSRSLGMDIKRYFEYSTEALEVMILKGNKRLSIDRCLAASNKFLKLFRKMYEK